MKDSIHLHHSGVTLQHEDHRINPPERQSPSQVYQPEIGLCVAAVEGETGNVWSWERSPTGLQSVCLNSRETEPIHHHGNLISTMCPMQMNSTRNQGAVVLPIVAEEQEGC